MALDHGGKLPAQIMCILNAAGEAETAGGRMAMCGVSNQENPARTEFRGQHPLQRPACDLVDGHRQVMDAERQTHVPFDLFVGEIFRTTFALIGDVEGPLFAVRAPMVGPHRHEHRHLADSGTPDPRTNTSGSRASFDRSAEIYAVAVCATTPRPS